MHASTRARACAAFSVIYFLGAVAIGHLLSAAMRAGKDVEMFSQVLLSLSEALTESIIPLADRFPAS